MNMRQPYPTAAELPEVKADQAKGAMGDQVSPEMNPVLEALRTLQQFVMVAEKKGDPNAGALKEALVSFVQTMAGGGAGGGEGAGAPKMPGKPGEEAPPEEGEQPEETAQAPEGEEVPPEAEDETEDDGMPMDEKKMMKRKLNKRVGNAVPMV